MGQPAELPEEALEACLELLHEGMSEKYPGCFRNKTVWYQTVDGEAVEVASASWNHQRVGFDVTTIQVGTRIREVVFFGIDGTPNPGRVEK